MIISQKNFFDLYPADGDSLSAGAGPGMITHVELLAMIAMIRAHGCKHVVEFGAGNGANAAAILRACPGVESYVGIDVPPGTVPELAYQAGEVPRVAGELAVGDPRYRVIVRPRGTRDVSPDELGPVDFIFIDGDHSESGVAYDTELAGRLVKTGVICWHDYGNGPAVGPQLVIDRINRADGDHICLIEGTSLCFEIRNAAIQSGTLGRAINCEALIHPHVPSELAQLFHAEDGGSTEIEYLNLLQAIINATKPLALLETGAHKGAGTVSMAAAVRSNGRGKLISVERDRSCCDEASARLAREGLGDCAEVVCSSSLDFLASTNRRFDFVFLDSHIPIRADELELLIDRQLLNPHAIVCIHDTSRVREFPHGRPDPESKVFWEKMDRIRGKVHSIIELPLSRGMALIGMDGERNTATKPVARRTMPGKIDASTARETADLFLESLEPYPQGLYHGRGVVICAGGPKYLTCAWVCINMLRGCGCWLPIELWHLNSSEMDSAMRRRLELLGVTCVNAGEVRGRIPARILNGWEIKPYAMLHSRFKEVLLLDADNVPIVDPTMLFDCAEYRRMGAIFWPDYGRLGPDRQIWTICKIPYRDESEFESGEIVVDKQRCWRALQLTMHLNEYSDFYYRHIHGDKETFHMAWRMVGQEYAMVPHGIVSLCGVMCQHDFDGRRIFQHRNSHKWTLNGPNTRIPGFAREDECLALLADLQTKWDGLIGSDHEYDELEKAAADEIAAQGRFQYIREGYDQRLMELKADGKIGQGRAGCEESWFVRQIGDQMTMVLAGRGTETCRLRRDPAGTWRGRWEIAERMPVQLIPLGDSMGK